MLERIEGRIPAEQALRVLCSGPSRLRHDCQRLLGEDGLRDGITARELLALAAVERLRRSGVVRQEWLEHAEQAVADAVMSHAAARGDDPRTRAVIVADGEYLAVPPLQCFMCLRTGETVRELPEAPLETWRLDLSSLEHRIHSEIERLSGGAPCNTRVTSED